MYRIQICTKTTKYIQRKRNTIMRKNRVGDNTTNKVTESYKKRQITGTNYAKSACHTTDT